MDLYELREKYIREKLEETIVPINPLDLFKKWYDQAKDVKIFEPNALALATATTEGIPSVRMLLLKGFDSNGFSFFSNYESRKAREIEENPMASIVVYWSELERQVRVCGKIEKLSGEESDKYFQTRPAGSRLGAWTSPQSKEITNRKWLEDAHFEFREKFKHGEIPRPANWGGYLLIPNSIEFWQGRDNRLHDRIEYYLSNKIWKTRRLAP